MGRIVVVENVSLDGVMQAPGGPEEDTRDGFDQGGWFQPYMDDVLGRYMGQAMTGQGCLLLGRRTYEQFADFWPQQTDNPFTPVLDATTKYVASWTLTEPLPWQNSVLLDGEATDAIRPVKADMDGDITVLGSGELVHDLADAGLVDEYLLSIAPLTLGEGRTLFRPGARTRLELVEAIPTSRGVIIARYQAQPGAQIR